MTLDQDRLSHDHEEITLVQFSPKIGRSIKQANIFNNLSNSQPIEENVYRKFIRLYQDPRLVLFQFCGDYLSTQIILNYNYNYKFLIKS